MADSSPHDETVDPQRERLTRPDADAVPPPDHIGRYRVEKTLGQGGFGVVYLARDEQLDRLVAIKVPHARLISKPEDTQAYLSEARTVANLDHPHIVPVYDVGSSEDCLCYVVSKYVEGTNLATQLKTQRPSYTEAAELVATVAGALHYAHKQGLVHRDVKPGNILLDKSGQPFVVDFGLALREDNLGKGPRYAGTPAYMSPEQARGEGHRVDGRSDVFSLGVVFYELLAGKPPFRGDTQAELLEQIASYEPRPLLQYDERLPQELQRICFKALSKRASERYSSAHEMADDLRHFLAGQAGTPAVATPAVAATASHDTAASASTVTSVVSAAASSAKTGSSFDNQPLKIVPKGLRSFDEEDKDFFLELLPGPRDREGLPDTIRFWKTRIEKTDADATFAAGVMYGPSGCGKSSLVKAGLLPRLADHVLPIFIEATPSDTELRLLKILRRHIPQLAAEASLAEALAQLREGRVTEGRKVLLVLDQFEQWLHATANMDGSQLVRALRQCDGANVQCLILVRDDFWMSTTRFMQSLEIPQVENQNSAAVDLFDPSHARKVLRAFGLAYGRLPEHDLSADEQRFLDRAVQDLSHDGKVICVQLSLLADMMKGRPWTPASLQEVGGTSGVGVAFLDETFTAKTAPPTHRLHAKAAQAVLNALLPKVGTDIKGQMQPADRLLECSGYAARPDDFRDLLQILNGELRLITPTEPEEAEAGVTERTASTADRRFYQLTHDYLVSSLRDWLTRKQKETRRGRAQLRLEERSAQWASKSEHRHLPSWWEYLHIRTFTRGNDWTDSQRRMMRVAARHYGLLASGFLALFLVAAVALQQFAARSQQRSVEDAVATLQTSHGLAVPGNIDNLRRLPKSMVKRTLGDLFEHADDERKLPLAYALADPDFGQVNRPFLVRAIATAHAEECDNLTTALAHDREAAVADLRTAAAATAKHDWKLKARLAVVALYLNDMTIAAEMLRGEPSSPGPQPWDPIQRTRFIECFPTWSGSVQELAGRLRDTDNISLRSGICLAVGGVKEPSADAKKAWRLLWAQWHASQPDSGTHSATGWALRTWQCPLPEIPPQQPNPKGFDWQLTKTGLTMIRIRAGEVEGATDETGQRRGKRIRIPHDFWLSDREVTAGQFKQFLNDKDAKKPDKPEEIAQRNTRDPSLPVEQVNWYDAVMFCNWLSRQEGRDPCYQKEGREQIRDSDNKTREFDAWKLIPGANGYRLPTEDEWEYACRAKTTTAFSFGDAEDLLDRYAVFVQNAKNGPDQVGRKLCNAWGLFDMHGNAMEWCQDWHTEGSDRVLRGGCWYVPAARCRTAYRIRSQPSDRISLLGFRVATVPSASKKVQAVQRAEPRAEAGRAAGRSPGPTELEREA